MFWKIYFLFLLAMIGLNVPSLLIEKSQLVDYVDLFFCIIGLIALFGYAFKNKLLNSTFWKLFAPAFVLWELFLLLYKNQLVEIKPLIIISLIIAIPGYLVVFLYAYRSVHFENDTR